MPPFEIIWDRVIQFQGNTLCTKRNRELTYQIHCDKFVCDRTNWNITKKDFEKGYNLWPVTGPGAFRDTINGPSYVWAILNDRRISQ